jgi:hypothetical protein
MINFIKSRFQVEGPQNERPSTINLEHVFRIAEMEDVDKDTEVERFGIAFIPADGTPTAWWYLDKGERDSELAWLEQKIGVSTGADTEPFIM